MEQLFKSNTVQQRKIMEWLVAQGITGADVAQAKLYGPAMVRVTNPAGQYMDLYCDGKYNVRILQVPEEREEDMQRCWDYEDDDPESMYWRDELTPDEAAMVEQWDAQYNSAMLSMCRKILNNDSREKNRTPDISPGM